MSWYNIGDIVRFADSIKVPPYEGIGMVWKMRLNPFDGHPTNFRAPMQICVHWFDNNRNAWYEETTTNLRKVGVNNGNV
jgi:hypothetical protein